MSGPGNRQSNSALFGTPGQDGTSDNPPASSPLGSTKLTFEEVLNYPGLFNYLDSHTFGEQYDDRTTSMFGMVQKLIQEYYKPDTTNNSGPYRAICLGIVDDGTGIQQPGKQHETFTPGSSEDLITRYTDIKIEPRVRIKARVPGIDTFPKPIGALSGNPTPAQLDIIKMHSTFTADMKRPVPQPGDLVYVDWRYKPKNGPWKEPVYLGRVNDNVSLSMEEVMKAVAAFLSACIGQAGAAGASGVGSPMSVPSDVTFRPSGLIYVPSEIWNKTGSTGKRAKYIYYLYEKQVKTQLYTVAGGEAAATSPAGDAPALNKIREYWDIDKLKTVVAYLAQEQGLGVQNAWITWGVMYGECRWRPIGILGHKPAGAMKFAADTGYGMGQYPRWIRYENTLRNHKKNPPIGVGTNVLVHGPETPHLSGKNYMHFDMLDPYVALKSIAVSYKRLFNWAASKGQTSPTPEALGAWWAGPGHKNKTGAEFQQACPKCVRKAEQIPKYGPQINTISGKYNGWANTQQLKADAEKIINERPIPKYKTYEEWTKEQEAAIEAEKNVSGIDAQFVGYAEDEANGVGGIKFDTRTMVTLVEGGKVAPVKEKSPGSGQFVLAGPWFDTTTQLGPDKPTYSDGYALKPEEVPESVKSAASAPATPSPPAATNKPLEQTTQSPSSQPGGSTSGGNTNPQQGKCPEGMVQIGTNVDGTPRCEPYNSPVAQTAANPQDIQNAASGSSGNSQTPTTSQPMSPDSIAALCAQLGALGTGGGGITQGTVNSLPPVTAGAGVPESTIRTAFDNMKQEAESAGGTIGDGRWKRKCLQFASYMAGVAGSPKVRRTTPRPKATPAWSGVRAGAIMNCPKVKTSDGKRFGRGMTIKELTAAHGTKGSNTLKPGWAVHVKASWTVDRAYDPKDDFHHWITYVGNDMWVDSRGIRSAAKQDGFLRGWFRGSYNGNDYVEMRQRTFGDKTLEQIPNKDRQPKVTAVHDPY